MKIQILGSGCPNCKNLHQIVEQVIKENKLEAEVEYLSGSKGVAKIMELGAMGSPVLVVDNRIVMTGAISDKNKILDLIQSGKKGESGCSCGGNC